MNEKSLTPGEVQIHPENKNTSYGIWKAMELAYLMSIKEADPTIKTKDPIPVFSDSDFEVLYEKHLKEFKTKFPRATENAFKDSQRKKIQNLLNEIVKHYPAFEIQDERYHDAVTYIEKYLTHEKASLEEPTNGVKAWIIICEMDEKETLPKVIERLQPKYSWKFNYKSLKNDFMPKIKKIVESIDNSKTKFEATPKQKKDLRDSISYLKDIKSKETAEKILKSIL